MGKLSHISPLRVCCESDIECTGPGTFQISRTAEAVGSLMRTSLQKAAASHSPAVAHAMLLALKDVAALYAALPPVIHRQQLQVWFSGPR